MLQRHPRAAIDRLKPHFDLRQLLGLPVGLVPLEHYPFAGLPGDDAAHLELTLDQASVRTRLEAHPSSGKSGGEFLDEHIERHHRRKCDVYADTNGGSAVFHLFFTLSAQSLPVMRRVLLLSWYAQQRWCAFLDKELT